MKWLFHDQSIEKIIATLALKHEAHFNEVVTVPIKIVCPKLNLSPFQSVNLLLTSQTKKKMMITLPRY